MSPVAPPHRHRCRVAFAGQYFLFLCPGFVGMAALRDVGGGDTTEVHPKCLTWLRCGWVGWEGQYERNCTNELSD